MEFGAGLLIGYSAMVTMTTAITAPQYVYTQLYFTFS
jgi:hypothetical protein